MDILLIPVGVAVLVVVLALVLRAWPGKAVASKSPEKEQLLAALNKGERTPEEVVEALAVLAERNRARDFWRAHIYELWILGGLLVAVSGALAGSQLLLGGVLASACLALLPVFIVPKGCEGRAALCIMFISLMSVVLVVYILFLTKWKGVSWGASGVILGFTIAFFAALLRGQAHHADRA
jgi:hypothetical protein